MSNTKYLLKEDGQLNHGHTTSGSPTIVQWHKATIYHRDDPTAHDRGDAWNTQNEWSGRSVWKPQSEREQLIADAHAAHDRGVELPKTTTATPTQELLHSHETKPVELPPTNGTNGSSANLGEEVLTAIAGRLNDVEDAALASLTTAQDAKTDLAQERARTDQIIKQYEEMRSQFAGAKLRIEQLEKAAETGKTLTIAKPDGTTTQLKGLKHFRQVDLIELMMNLDEADRNGYLAGPAGSGKTTGAFLVAVALFGEEKAKTTHFRARGAVATPFQISGYMDAKGEYVSTGFRHIYENGGVILLDEMDGSSANALLEINAATANGFHDFPDGLVPRHKDCYIIAAANTWGFGGDANYMGRNKLDDATLDRFFTLSWGYDNDLEMAFGKVPDWTRLVQSCRAACNTKELKIVISPRATSRGGALLSRGVRPQLVVEAIFGKFRERDGSWPEPLRQIDTWLRNYKPQAQSSSAPTTPTNTSSNLPQDPKHIDFGGTR